MVGDTFLRRNVTALHDQAGKGAEKFGVFTSNLSQFFKRLAGKSSSQDLGYDEEEGLLSSSTSSSSEEEVKRRLILTKRSSQSLDNAGVTEEQYILVLIGRFLAGVAITQGSYLVLTYQSQWDPKVAAVYTGVFGFFVATGMAFSAAIRSIVSLLLPTLCTSKGRSIAMAFCLMILMTGPSANIVYNYQQLSAALTCGDELGYNVTRGLSTLMHNEQNVILSSMDDTIDTIIEAVEEAEKIFMSFAKKVENVGTVVKSYNNFLRNMGEICEERLGSFFCIAPKFVMKIAKKFITEPLGHAIQTVKKEFQFKMSYRHDFVYEANVSKSSREITQDIMKEVKETTGLAMSVLDWVKFAMTFSTGFVFIASIKYRYKYLTNPEFDNCYITDQFVENDKKKARHGKLAVLPLRARESALYIRPGRIWMSKEELKKFAKGFTFLTFNFIYTITVLLIDYGFWRLLSFMTLSLSLQNQSNSLIKDLINKGISSVGSASGLGEQTQNVMKDMVGIVAQGSGFMAIIYRSIASGIEKIASTEGYEFRIDKCLPRARLPNYAVHTVLLIMYAFLYAECILEPYLLRIRRRIMSVYYPRREKARLLYLRTKILSKRGIGPGGLESLVKNASLNSQKTREMQKVDFFAKYASGKGIIGVLARCLSGRTKYRCHVCNLAGGEKDRHLFKRCGTFGCSAVYCQDCYIELHRMCIVCLEKEAKVVQKERKMSKLGIRMQERRHSEEAEFLVYSSGISDSSAESSEEDERWDGAESENSETVRLIETQDDKSDGYIDNTEYYGNDDSESVET